MPDVFISYSHKDHFFAELLRTKLEDIDVIERTEDADGKEREEHRKLKVWLDGKSLRPGDRWSERLDKGISDCKVMVIAISDASARSIYVTYEWARAITLKKGIIPVVIEDVDMHDYLQTYQRISFRDREAINWDTLVDAVREAVENYESPADDRDMEADGEVLAHHDPDADGATRGADGRGGPGFEVLGGGGKTGPEPGGPAPGTPDPGSIRRVEALRNDIDAYLSRNGFRLVSRERIMKRYKDKGYREADFDALLQRFPESYRASWVRISTNPLKLRRGIARR